MTEDDLDFINATGAYDPYDLPEDLQAVSYFLSRQGLKAAEISMQAMDQGDEDKGKMFFEVGLAISWLSGRVFDEADERTKQARLAANAKLAAWERSLAESGKP